MRSLSFDGNGAFNDVPYVCITGMADDGSVPISILLHKIGRECGLTEREVSHLVQVTARLMILHCADPESGEVSQNCWAIAAYAVRRYCADDQALLAEVCGIAKRWLDHHGTGGNSPERLQRLIHGE